MAIRINGRTIRNIPEQVAKNLHDIDTLDTEVDSVATDIALLAARVAAALAGVFHYKGTVASYAALPSSGMQVGDTYNVLDTGENYTWSGSSWDRLSGIVDLSNYLDKSSPNQSIDYTASYDFDIGASVKFDSAGDQYRVMAVGTTLDVAAFNDNQWKSYIQIDSDSEAIDIYKSATFNSVVDFVDDVSVEGDLYVATLYRNGINLPIYVGDDLAPADTNEFDLGSSTNAWKDIYLSGGFNKNASGYKLTLPSTASLTADSELLDTASAQTIKGRKIFTESKSVYFGDENFPTRIYQDGQSIKFGSRLQVGIIFPTVDKQQDIGNGIGWYWRDLWLSRNIVTLDSNNVQTNISMQDLINLITYAKAQGWIS